MLGRNKKEVRRRQPQLMAGQDDISFRRSRTLQGTTSSNVRAVNPKRAELKSKRLKEQNMRRRRRLVVSVFISVAFLFVGIWFLVGQYTTNIGTLSFTPETESQPDQALYKAKIEEYLNENPSERFRFAMNKDSVSNFVSQTMPEVKNVKPSGVLSSKPDFTVTLRKPVAGWKSGSAQAYVDDTGVSFSKNYYKVPAVVILDKSGVNSGGGAAVVSERLLRFLGRLIYQSNSLGLGEISGATLPESTTRQVDIKIKGKNYTIKTHIDRDPAATVEDIKRVESYLKQKDLSAKYIDVRVSGRAFYK